MAFQSSVFRDGQWVTETVNLQDALRASAVPKPTSAPRAEPPVCGLLSTTIVESPVVHWALPVRLRSRAHNDVAFIGVSPFSFSDLSVFLLLCLSTLCWAVALRFDTCEPAFHGLFSKVYNEACRPAVVDSK